jgi:hypothetical protein
MQANSKKEIPKFGVMRPQNAQPNSVRLCSREHVSFPTFPCKIQKNAMRPNGVRHFRAPCKLRALTRP